MLTNVRHLVYTGFQARNQPVPRIGYTPWGRGSCHERSTLRGLSHRIFHPRGSDGGTLAASCAAKQGIKWRFGGRATFFSNRSTGCEPAGGVSSVTAGHATAIPHSCAGRSPERACPRRHRRSGLARRGSAASCPNNFLAWIAEPIRRWARSGAHPRISGRYRHRPPGDDPRAPNSASIRVRACFRSDSGSGPMSSPDGPHRCSVDKRVLPAAPARLRRALTTDPLVRPGAGEGLTAHQAGPVAGDTPRRRIAFLSIPAEFVHRSSPACIDQGDDTAWLAGRPRISCGRPERTALP